MLIGVILFFGLISTVELWESNNTMITPYVTAFVKTGPNRTRTEIQFTA